MNFLFDLFARVLNFFYELYPSYGFTIIGLTLLVMVILTPLTLKGTRSMMMMQQLQPELKKLQSKYKDDIQKRNEEMMKFYRENNINPVGGCLPLLVQMPVFLVLYQVLRGLTQRVPNMGSKVGWVTGQSGSGSALSKPPIIRNVFQPDHLAHDSKMYQDLSTTNTMPFFGMDLSESASEALGRSIGHAIPYLVLIVIVGITGFVQQKQIQGRMQVSDMSDQQRQQQQIMKIMPIFLPVISFGLPSGLVVYFAVSNLYRVGQQWFISRSIYGIRRGETEAAEAAAGGRSSGGTGGNGKGGPSKGGPSKGAGPKGGGPRGGASKRDDGEDEPTAVTSSRTATKTATKAAKPPAKTVPRKSPVKAEAEAKGSSSAKSAPNRKPDRGGNARSAPSTKPAAAKPAAGKAARDTNDRPPTLQPRARKNKKR